ncbi:MAG: four helix bundle protein [Gammaproteobacteria bacterium]
MSHAKFYELPVWRAARRLQQIVYAHSNQGNFRKDWRLRDQIRSAAASVMANIAEGYGRRYDKECVQFLFQAKASGAEVQSTYLWPRTAVTWMSGASVRLSTLPTTWLVNYPDS